MSEFTQYPFKLVSPDFSDSPGLGLSICQAYIKALGGDIRVQSKKDRGTSVFFSIKKNDIPKEELIL